MNNALDELLADSAPPVSPRTPDAEEALAEMVADARGEVLQGRRLRTAVRAGGAVAVLGVVAAGTAAAAGILPGSGPEAPWNVLAEEAAPDATVFEWVGADAHGTRCVFRLTGFDLAESTVREIESALSDPQRLLAEDAGAVREEFLSEGWALPADSELVDAAYAEVARIDYGAGREGLADGDLSSDISETRADEIFLQVYMRVVLDGIGAGPDQGDSRIYLNPETACEVAK